MSVYLVYAFDYPHNYYCDFILRYEKVLELLEEHPEISKQYKVIKPGKLEMEQLKILHDEFYLKRLEEISKKDEKIREALLIDLLGVSGTLSACELSLQEKGVTYHLGGGFTHASKDKESAFDYLNDIGIAVEWLRKKHGLKKIMIINLDVHHADGIQKLFYHDRGVMQISFHGWNIFPGTGDVNEIGEGEGKGYKINLPFLAGTSDETYLWAMDVIIPKYSKLFKPEFIIYQAGVDCLLRDPLGNLKLTLEGVYERDKKIRDFFKNSPLVIIRGGGYNNEYSPKANLNTLACFANLPIVYKHGKKISEPKKCRKWAEKKLEELEKLLAEYW
ncbi:MAG: histone deacetylase [Candidatus Aenigmatarchaeota archaeon]